MPEDVVTQILNKLQDRSPEQKQADTLRLHRAEIMKVRGKEFYRQFAAALQALAKRLEAESNSEIAGVDFSPLPNTSLLYFSTVVPSRLMISNYTEGNYTINFSLSTDEQGRKFPVAGDRKAYLRVDEHDNVYVEFRGIKFTTGKALAEKMMEVLFLTELQ